MSQFWVAFIDDETWQECPKGNPFASLASLYEEARRLLVAGAEVESAVLRFDAVRRAIDRRIADLVGEDVRGVKRLTAPMAPEADWSDPSSELEVARRLAIASPGEAQRFLEAAIGQAQGDDVEALRVAAGRNGTWVVWEVDTFAPTASPVLRSRFALVPQGHVRTAPLELVPTDLQTGHHALSVLEAEFVTAASVGRPAAVGRAADATLMEALWLLSATIRRPGELMIRYGDDTVGPVQLRPMAGGGDGERVDLVSGLMTMRHPPLDYECSFYWLRNERLSACSRMADAAKLARDDALRILERLAVQARRPLRVKLHLTGFHPAIAGLVDAIHTYEGPPIDLEIVPLYYRGDAEPEPGHAWSLVAS